MNWTERRRQFSRGDQDLLKQALDEGVAQSVILTRIEQEREEVRVTQLLTDDAYRLEDVELIQEAFQRFQVGVLDYEDFECLPIFEKFRRVLGRDAHALVLGRSNFVIGFNHMYLPD